MKKTAIYSATLLLLLVLNACTQNKGNIGYWFGHWHLESITINSQKDTDYSGRVFWAFQSNVIEMIETHPGPDDVPLDMERAWGTWSEKDGNLVLDFTHGDDAQPPGSPLYIPLPATHLPKGISVLKIDKINGSELILTYTATNGDIIRYTFSKQG